MLVIDDSTLDKPYARHIDLVTRHWSGKHHEVVRGINLITLLWTDGDRKIPVDYRIYSKADGKTKNDHFWEMLLMAKGRGFAPKYVLFDGWYASLENLKQVRDHGWRWLTRLKGNRLVNARRTGSAGRCDEVAVSALRARWSTCGATGWSGCSGSTPQTATRSTGRPTTWRWTTGMRRQYAELGFAIENYHRELKQNCGVERCQARSERAQRNHIGLALRAFLRLEWHFFTTGVSWFEAKMRVVRDAVRRYLSEPLYGIPKPSIA